MTSMQSIKGQANVRFGINLLIAAFGLCVLSQPLYASMYAEKRAMNWWNSLSPEQMVAALYGDMATMEQATAAKKMYSDLDDETKMMVDAATATIWGKGGHKSVGAWWETLNCQKMRIAAGDGNTADSSSAFCAHYPGSGSAKILSEESIMHVNHVGKALLGRDEPGTYPAHNYVAMRWWNVLNGDQMVASLYGNSASADEMMAAKHMYADLDPERRRLVHAATAEIYGDGGFASVGVWWETLDCRKMRIAAGDGNEADSGSMFCAHYPDSGLTELSDMAKEHVDKVGMALLGRNTPGMYPTMYTIPFFPTSWDGDGLARVVNRGGRAVDVKIMAYDDKGMSYGPVMLMIPKSSAAHFNADDLEMGNPDTRLMGRIGMGHGDWRLVLTSTLPLKATGFIANDFNEIVANLQDVVPAGMNGHMVNLFYGSTDTLGDRVSYLRIINPGAEMAYVSIEGTDDSGMMGDSKVELMVYPYGAKTVSARALESGGQGMTGSLGDGIGNWRLRVTSPQMIKVMSLVDPRGGSITNVSTAMNHTY